MSPVFAHGQLRLYLLVLLDEGPRHGYEVIQELESRFNGLYSPSAGTVYPRLAKLEEEGLVQRTDDGRKGTYAITDAGRAEVRARQADVQDLRDDLDQSVRQLAEQVRSRVQHRAADLRTELKNAAREARATATPVGGHEPWTRGEAAAYADLEHAVNTFRSDVRRAWRRGGLTADQTREVVDILTDAAARIRAVVGREWLRGEPVAGVVEVRGTRWGRVALVVILVVISSYVSSDSRGCDGLAWTHVHVGVSPVGRAVRWSLGAGGEAAALLPRRCRVGSDLDHTARHPGQRPRKLRCSRAAVQSDGYGP